MQLLHHLADSVASLLTSQPTSSASIELVSSSTRVTSVTFQKGVVMREIERPGPIEPDPRDTWVR